MNISLKQGAQRDLFDAGKTESIALVNAFSSSLPM
jgi:hypothetical protein